MASSDSPGNVISTDDYPIDDMFFVDHIPEAQPFVDYIPEAQPFVDHIPEAQPRKVTSEGDATPVKYDYLFKKKLTYSDVNHAGIHVLRADVKEHFSSLQTTDMMDIQVYDIIRLKTMEWKLSNKDNKCYIRGTADYFRSNDLKKGDSILFYRKTSGQIGNRGWLPPYLVRYEKSGDTFMSAVYSCTSGVSK